MRRHVALVAAAAVLLPMAGVVAAATSPVSAVTGVLAGTTTIEWTGRAAIVLNVPKTTSLRGGDVDLRVKGATYAMVRMVGPPESACSPDDGPRCRLYSVSWLRQWANDAGYYGPPGADHDVDFVDPPVFVTPKMELYLLTDGWARVTLRTGLSGTSAYRAAGRFTGGFTTLRPSCAPLDCATASPGTITYGGATVDVGPLGLIEGIAMTSARGETPVYGAVQPQNAYPCFFPNRGDRDASTDPSDYPLGCGVVPDPAGGGAGETTSSLIFNAANVTPVGAAMAYTRWSAARGREYVGFRAVAAGPFPVKAAGFALWIRYGVR